MRRPGCPLPTPARLARARDVGSCKGSQCLSCGDLPCPGFESFFPSPFSSASPWQSVLLVQIPIFLGGAGHISRELVQPNRGRGRRVNRVRASSKGEAYLNPGRCWEQGLGLSGACGLVVRAQEAPVPCVESTMLVALAL